jgi:hypothetical protein
MLFFAGSPKGARIAQGGSRLPYAGSNLGGATTFVSVLEFNCTTGDVISTQPAPASDAIAVPTLSRLALGAIVALLVLLAGLCGECSVRSFRSAAGAR